MTHDNILFDCTVRLIPQGVMKRQAAFVEFEDSLNGVEAFLFDISDEPKVFHEKYDANFHLGKYVVYPARLLSLRCVI